MGFRKGSMKRKVTRTCKCTHQKKTFESITEATKDIPNVRNPIPCVMACLKGKQISAYGYTWEYADKLD